jgi:hypothetical protein
MHTNETSDKNIGLIYPECIEDWGVLLQSPDGYRDRHDRHCNDGIYSIEKTNPHPPR